VDIDTYKHFPNRRKGFMPAPDMVQSQPNTLINSRALNLARFAPDAIGAEQLIWLKVGLVFHRTTTAHKVAQINIWQAQIDCTIDHAQAHPRARRKLSIFRIKIEVYP
jgi:hypothetical protein